MGESIPSRRPIATTSTSTTTMKRSTKTTIAAALLLATATAVTAAPLPKTRTIEIRSSPITFKYGEVHNRWQEPIPFPEDVVAQFANGTMALVDYKLDIVYENGSRVPLYDVYNHHYRLTVGTTDTMDAFYEMMKPEDVPYGVSAPDGLEGWVRGAKNPVDFAQEQKVHNRKLMMSTFRAKQEAMEAAQRANTTDVATFGSASGAEERGTSHKLPDGYAFLADQPEAITGLYHFINTRAPPSLPRSSSRRERPADFSSVLAPLRESSMRTMALLMGGPPSPPSAHAARNSSI